MFAGVVDQFVPSSFLYLGTKECSFQLCFLSLGRSVVYQQSSKESATLQPFFTLQLDIQSDRIRTVQDALESLVARESVQGYTTKTRQEVQCPLVLTPGC